MCRYFRRTVAPTDKSAKSCFVHCISFSFVNILPAGRLCEISLNACSEHLCEHNSTCRPKGTTFTCECPSDYQGQYCELKITGACTSGPCKNGAICTEEGEFVTCDCVTGYTGVYCESSIDPCLSQPCQHGGECNPTGYDAICNCPRPYKGRFCHVVHLPLCGNMPCLNNGTCIDNLDTPLGYRCECLNDTSGVTYGDNCEIASACASSPCQYGGTCVVRQDGGYQCECVENYGGIFCEEYTGPLTTIEDNPTREKTKPTRPTATSKFDQLP